MTYLSSVPVFNTRVHIGTFEDILQITADTIRRGKIICIDTSNTMVVTLAATDENFRRALGSFDMLFPDSMPLVWYMRLVGGNITHTCYAPETALRVWNSFFRDNKIMIIGSDDKTRSLFENALGKPTDWITARIDPYDAQTIKWLQRKINMTKPDIIFLCLGCPKSYYLLEKIKGSLDSCVVIHVGGSFDILSGRKKITPNRIQRLGLGWLYRLCHEPRRLIGRYSKFNSLFILLALIYYHKNRKSFRSSHFL